MSKRIELSIPYDAATMLAFSKALKESAEALTPCTCAGCTAAPVEVEPITMVTLAGKEFDVSDTPAPADDVTPPVKVISTASEAVEAFGEGSDLARVAAGCTEEEPPPPPPAATEDDAPPPPPATVTLDAAGLPFDARIHGSGRSFYASGAVKGNWKAKRQVDPALVVSVEAELRAALAVPGPTSEQLEELPSTEIATVGQFLTACTAKGLPPLEVTEACKKHGVEGVPVLATRPDLIPLVAAELGL